MSTTDTERGPGGEPAPSAPSRARRIALSAVTLCLLYGNAAVALQPPALVRAGFHLPTPRWVRDAFLMSGMFTSWSRVNVDPFIAGLRSDAVDPNAAASWIPIDVREHFPERHGVTFTRLFAMHHWDVHGVAAQRRAWEALAAKIRARHNRLHPERSVRRVRFGCLTWPQSKHGFRANKRPGSIDVHLWYDEREAPR